MANSEPKTPAPNRALRVLVVLLALSNLGLGVFGYFVLRGVDDRYSKLIAASVPVLNDLRELSVTVATTNRSMLGGLLAVQDGGLRSQAAAKIRAGLIECRRETAVLLETGKLGVTGEADVALRTAVEEFVVAMEAMPPLIENNRLDAARTMREERVRPAFERLFGLLAHVADEVEMRSLKTSAEYSARSRKISSFLFGVGSWPLALGVAIISLTVVIVGVMLFVFRGADAQDGV